MVDRQPQEPISTQPESLNVRPRKRIVGALALGAALITTPVVISESNNPVTAIQELVITNF